MDAPSKELGEGSSPMNQERIAGSVGLGFSSSLSRPLGGSRPPREGGAGAGENLLLGGASHLPSRSLSAPLTGDNARKRLCAPYSPIRPSSRFLWSGDAARFGGAGWAFCEAGPDCVVSVRPTLLLPVVRRATAKPRSRSAIASVPRYIYL